MHIRTTQADLNSDMINFGLGQPDMNILPLAALREASTHRLTRGDTELLNYGQTEGDGYLLLALAQFLSEMYPVPVSRESLFITGGNSHAIDLICTRFTKPGDTIFVEEATYFLAYSIFADHGLHVVEIPIDEDGMRMDALAAKLTEIRPAFIYTIPTFHNPTTVSLSAERAAQLVALSREHDFLIVADEVYQLLGYRAPASRPLASYSDGENVLSLGTFSKILAPGLRVGWIQTSPKLRQHLIATGYVYSGGSVSHFAANMVRSLLELGLQQGYLERLKSIYRKRIEVMDKAIQQHFPETVRYQKPTGGYFFWLAFPEGVNTADWVATAKAHQVGFHPGALFTKNGVLDNYLRLSFAFYDSEKIEQGIGTLGALFKEAA